MQEEHDGLQVKNGENGPENAHSPDFRGSDFPVPFFRNLLFPAREEIAEWERILNEGDLYIRLMKTIKVDKIMSREKFKGMFFHFLYRSAFHKFDTEYIHYYDEAPIFVGRDLEPIRKAMVALVPAVVHFLDLCKCREGTLRREARPYFLSKSKKRVKCHAHISMAMQSVESKIILECCSNLWKKYPKMFLTTLHDSIKCLPKDIKKVEEELKNTFRKYGINPRFTPELYGAGKNSDSTKEHLLPTSVLGSTDDYEKKYLTKQEIADKFLDGASIKTVERFLKRHPQLKKLKITDKNRIAHFPLDEIAKCIEREKALPVPETNDK